MNSKLFLIALLFISTGIFSQREFSINDFYSNNEKLDAKVEEIFNSLKPGERVAQLIMPAAGRLGDSDEKIDAWVKNKQIGGLLLLNGTKEEGINRIKKYNAINKGLGVLPFLYSADAEPSLVNRKIIGTTPIKNANKMTSKNEVIEAAQKISNELKEIGINYNLAPVVDMSPNKTVGWRGFGQEPDSVISWSNAFITETQNHNIMATAKHFPGHGFVEGDTHKNLVYIKGEMKEVDNYIPIIDNNVMSILIAHIAVEGNDKYNTNGEPASISKIIITDLLRNDLGFKGLIVTDAMNMLGVSKIEGANVKAIDAGIDILLMPLDAEKAHQEITEKYLKNRGFKEKVDAACKRVIRAKLCVAD